MGQTISIKMDYTGSSSIAAAILVIAWWVHSDFIDSSFASLKCLD
jgi:hypothetical protein